MRVEDERLGTVMLRGMPNSCRANATSAGSQRSCSPPSIGWHTTAGYLAISDTMSPEDVHHFPPLASAAIHNCGALFAISLQLANDQTMASATRRFQQPSTTAMRQAASMNSATQFHFASAKFSMCKNTTASGSDVAPPGHATQNVQHWHEPQECRTLQCHERAHAL